MQHSADGVDRFTAYEVHLDGKRTVFTLQAYIGAADFHGAVEILLLARDVVQVQEGLAGGSGFQGHSLALVPFVLGCLLVEVVGGREISQRSAFGAAHPDEERCGAAGYREGILPAFGQFAGDETLIAYGGAYDLAGVGVVRVVHIGHVTADPMLHLWHKMHEEGSLDGGLAVSAHGLRVRPAEGEVAQELPGKHDSEALAGSIDCFDFESHFRGRNAVPYGGEACSGLCAFKTPLPVFALDGEAVAGGALGHWHVESGSIHKLLGEFVPARVASLGSGTDWFKILFRGLPVQPLVHSGGSAAGGSQNQGRNCWQDFFHSAISIKFYNTTNLIFFMYFCNIIAYSERQ